MKVTAAEANKQKKKILIEFFDPENLNNCISQLHSRYDGIYYLYFESQRRPDSERLFKSLVEFNRRRAGTEPVFVPIKNESLDEITRELDRITAQDAVFEIDITGGPELFIIAGGMFMNGRVLNNISIHRYDITTGKMVISYPATAAENENNYTISVGEQIKLHGAVVVPDSRNIFDLSENGLEKNILRLWNAVKRQPAKWNSFCTLQRIQKVVGGKTVIYLRTGSDGEKKTFRAIADDLVRLGIITLRPEETVGGSVYTPFTVNMPKNTLRLFKKGGNLLEMYTYLACLKNKKIIDVCTGVPLDWDGVITGESGETKNEIDVIASDGRIPLFISCKNTAATNEHFYEIKAMTRHYGGKFAKAILVSNSRSNDAIRKRAEAMGIKLIDNVAGLSLEEFSRLITEEQ